MKRPYANECDLVLKGDKQANKLGLWIVGFATIYQFILCLMMSIGAPMGSKVLMLAELIVYVFCFYVFYEKKFTVFQLAVLWFAVTNLFVLFLFRTGIDLKSLRDILIPIFFFLLGLRYANYEKLDHFVFYLTVFLIAIAIIEMLFPAFYGNVLPTLKFQASTGAVNVESAMYKGQTLTLNSFRPEGIGRTWFPGLLSNQRAASMFIEPVSFGNFAVILSAWGLVRPFGRRLLQYLGMVFIILVLTDSRFATMVVILLIFIRLLPLNFVKPIVFLIPVFVVSCLLLVANFAEYTGDNLVGRLYVAGTGLIKISVSELLGAIPFAHSYADLGYSYVISRFGIIFAFSSWLVLFFAYKGNYYAECFRLMIATYIACILAVSGTSLFALKTAALLWFMMGVFFSKSDQLSQKGFN